MQRRRRGAKVKLGDRQRWQGEGRVGHSRADLHEERVEEGDVLT